MPYGARPGKFLIIRGFRRRKNRRCVCIGQGPVLLLHAAFFGMVNRGFRPYSLGCVDERPRPSGIDRPGPPAPFTNPRTECPLSSIIVSFTVSIDGPAAPFTLPPVIVVAPPAPPARVQAPRPLWRQLLFAFMGDGRD